MHDALRLAHGSLRSVEERDTASGGYVLASPFEELDVAPGDRVLEGLGQADRLGRHSLTARSRLTIASVSTGGSCALAEALGEQAATYRLALYNGERTRWVFHHLLTQRGAVAGGRIQSLHRAFASAVKRAELPSDLRQHDLRHRRVTTWLAAGQSPALVQRAMGHADLATTMGYAHLVDDDLLTLVAVNEDEQLRELAEGA